MRLHSYNLEDGAEVRDLACNIYVIWLRQGLEGYENRLLLV